MIVYGDRTRTVVPADELRRLAATDDPDELSIRFAMLEAGLADALMPEADELYPLLQTMGETATRLARGERPDLLALADLPLPADVVLKTPEGHAWYALYPETYRAAGEVLADLARGPVTVLGLRSIGTGLSTAVAEGLRRRGLTARRWTLRPRGHPFDRHPRIAPALHAWLAEGASGWFAVVDEGPGLSGSSFCGTAAWLEEELGIPPARIALLPAWRPDPVGFRSPAARTRWPCHPVIQIDAEKVLPDLALPEGGTDLSAGQWRRHLRRWTPVQPQHERRKHLLPGGTHVRRFAGLGPFGRPILDRAALLAGAGFGPRPHGLRHGLLALDWIDGRPATDIRPHADRILAYLTFLARTFRSGEPCASDPLLAMIEANLGTAPAVDRSLLAARPAVAVDGRMLRHEWIETASGLMKADALDHHADHFFPGCQDTAWDVAGLAIETGLDLGEALAASLPDPDLVRLMPFYRTAYAAWRTGYCTLAAQSLPDGPDKRGFERLAARYRREAMA